MRCHGRFRPGTTIIGWDHLVYGVVREALRGSIAADPVSREVDEAILLGGE